MTNMPRDPTIISLTAIRATVRLHADTTASSEQMLHDERLAFGELVSTEAYSLYR